MSNLRFENRLKYQPLLATFFILPMFLMSGCSGTTTTLTPTLTPTTKVSLCSPEQLLSERNPTEKIYCYAEKYNVYLDEDAYMNNPIFEELIPIASSIIALEEKGNLTDLERLQKVRLEGQIQAIFNRTPAPLASPSQQTKTVPNNRQCCKICTTGKACGDACISRNYNCNKSPGGACDATNY